jgi:hypothetical protein
MPRHELTEQLGDYAERRGDDVGVNVPEEFRRIGYSGVFHVDAVLSIMSTDTIIEWKAKVPCLLPTDGWMALSIDCAAGTVTVVRRDAAALVDIATGGPR